MASARKRRAVEAAVGRSGPTIPDVRRARDEELAASGWKRRFTGAPPRLAEVQELYRATGQEVLLDDLVPGELEADCAGCALALTVFKAVYTRPIAAKGDRT